MARQMHLELPQLSDHDWCAAALGPPNHAVNARDPAVSLCVAAVSPSKALVASCVG